LNTQILHACIIHHWQDQWFLLVFLKHSNLFFILKIKGSLKVSLRLDFGVSFCAPARACRGENGTDYFRPTDRPKAYGTHKRIQSDSYRIRLVINGYGKGYGFTNIRSYPKIYHISRLYPDNIRQNIRQWVLEYVTGERR
jgi:hypothetical protein